MTMNNDFTYFKIIKNNKKKQLPKQHYGEFSLFRIILKYNRKANFRSKTIPKILFPL